MNSLRHNAGKGELESANWPAGVGGLSHGQRMNAVMRRLFPIRDPTDFWRANSINTAQRSPACALLAGWLAGGGLERFHLGLVLHDGLSLRRPGKEQMGVGGPQSRAPKTPILLMGLPNGGGEA